MDGLKPDFQPPTRWKYPELLFVLRAKYLMCLSGLPAREWSVSLTLMVQLLWWTWLEQIGCLRDPTVPGIPSAWMRRWSLRMNLSSGFSRHWHQASLLTAQSAGKAGAHSNCPKRGLKVGGDHHEGMAVCSRGLGWPRFGKKAITQGLVNVNRLTNNLPGWATNFCSKGETGRKRNTRTNRCNKSHCWTWFPLLTSHEFSCKTVCYSSYDQTLVALWCINFSSLGIDIWKTAETSCLDWKKVEIWRDVHVSQSSNFWYYLLEKRRRW